MAGCLYHATCVLPLAQKSTAHQPAGRKEPFGLGCGRTRLGRGLVTLAWPRTRYVAHLDFVVGAVVDVKALGCIDPLHGGTSLLAA